MWPTKGNSYPIKKIVVMLFWRKERFTNWVHRQGKSHLIKVILIKVITKQSKFRDSAVCSCGCSKECFKISNMIYQWIKLLRSRDIYSKRKRRLQHFNQSTSNSKARNNKIDFQQRLTGFLSMIKSNLRMHVNDEKGGKGGSTSLKLDSPKLKVTLLSSALQI